MKIKHRQGDCRTALANEDELIGRRNLNEAVDISIRERGTSEEDIETPIESLA